MDLNFSPDELAFRDEVRAFVREQLPDAIRRKVTNGGHLTRAEHVQWQRALHARGWAGQAWPKEFGGTGWTPTQQYIFEEECAAAGAPRLIPFGTKMVGPVIMAFGNAAQKDEGIVARQRDHARLAQQSVERRPVPRLLEARRMQRGQQRRRLRPHGANAGIRHVVSGARR